MWSRLLSRPQEADVIALEDDLLTLQTRGPLKGEQVRLRQDREWVIVRLAPVSVRSVPDGFVYTARVIEGLRRLRPGVRAGAEGAGYLRGARRRPFRSRVLSRDLPGYKGMTIDISRGGLQIEAAGVVEVGSILRLNLDRSEESGAVTLEARVAWCGAGQGRVRVGLEFLGSAHGESRALDRLFQSLEDGEILSVSERLARSARAEEPTVGIAPLRWSALPLQGALHGYARRGTRVCVEMGDGIFSFESVGMLTDRLMGDTPTVRLESAFRGGGMWLYRWVTPSGTPVLELRCGTAPQDLA